MNQLLTNYTTTYDNVMLIHEVLHAQTDSRKKMISIQYILQVEYNQRCQRRITT